jgi:hypothetical protein
MASGTKDTRAITEDVSISGEVKSMVSTTGDLQKMAHFVRDSIAILDLLSLKLLSLSFLHLLFIVFKGEHFLLLELMLLHHLLLLKGATVLIVFITLNVVLL